MKKRYTPDAELIKAVLEINPIQGVQETGGFYGDDDYCVSGFRRSRYYGSDGQTEWVEFNPLHDMGDAWHIIFNNKISIVHLYNDTWKATIANGVAPYIENESGNPLFSAMTVLVEKSKHNGG